MIARRVSTVGGHGDEKQQQGWPCLCRCISLSEAISIAEDLQFLSLPFHLSLSNSEVLQRNENYFLTASVASALGLCVGA